MEEKSFRKKAPLRETNLGGHFYNQGIIPLQSFLHITTPQVSQVWLADGATGAGLLIKLREWWECIVNEGSKFGYFVNDMKSWLIIKDEALRQLAEELFHETNINITSEGDVYLGVFWRQP